MNAHLVRRIRCAMGLMAKNELVREDVPVTATALMTENSACATVLADSLASGQKKNVLSCRIPRMDRYFVTILIVVLVRMPPK